MHVQRHRDSHPPCIRSRDLPARLTLVVSAVMLALPTACSTDRDPADLLAPIGDPLLVVDAVLLVNHRFPIVRVTETSAVNEPYSADASAIVGATVHVEGGGERIAYFDTETPGVYRNRNGTARVLAETTYTLTVEAPDGRVARAETRTPAPFRVDSWLILDDTGSTVEDELASFSDGQVYIENELVYGEGLLEARFERPDVPAFQVGIRSLDPDSELVTPLDEFGDEDDFDREGSSPALEGLGGSVRLPWFAIFYAGRHLIRINALDRNWYDLIRSVPELNGGAGFGQTQGDGVERPIFHVDGGIGLFGSAAVDSIGFVVLPPD